jgi:hypothetical protein
MLHCVTTSCLYCTTTILYCTANTGQLGLGNTLIVGVDETPGSIAAIDFGPNVDVTAVSIGGDFVCAILDNVDLKSWGWNVWGKLE